MIRGLLSQGHLLIDAYIRPTHFTPLRHPMPRKISGYLVSENALSNWVRSNGVSIPAPGHPHSFIMQIAQAFDAHPHDLGHPFMEIFDVDTISIPSKDGSGDETMYFFVRAYADPTQAYNKAHLTEKENDRRVKKVLQAVLSTELSPWVENIEYPLRRIDIERIEPVI
ncbi:hypothetical protein H0H81_011378 [Sphagnurus paluster]|uniref:Uncharacterized protein n=1 Tax=Sphagnurus paluster TaxID=117069 RepID=A0A9P7KJF3_9AGAR|nr:hypothetical protein H0H81_011378 [Sphagnurus paluster]